MLFYPINRKLLETGAMYLGVYNELFINGEKTFFDRNRLYGGIGYKYSQNIEFQIETDLEKIVQCNCSICIRRNAKMIMVPKDNFNLIKGEEELALYQFNSNIAKHYFCKKCGIYTHHNRKSDPNGMGVNLGCVDELDATDYDAISFDGRKL